MFGKEKGPRERSSLVWRGQIVGMHQSGESIMTISQMLGLHRTTGARWIKRFEEEGDVSTRPKIGRFRATTIAQDQELIDSSDRNSKKISIALHREVMHIMSVSAPFEVD